MRDRIQIYVNNKFIGVQYQEEIGDEILFETSLDNQNDLKILVEKYGQSELWCCCRLIPKRIRTGY